jgi:hypothetical protein
MFGSEEGISEMTRFGASALIAAGLIAVGLSAPANAAVVDYTSSAAFNAATTGDSFTVENYGTGTNGQTIANGGSFDGLTYTVTPGPIGTLTGTIITNIANSFSGLTLGGNQSGGQQYFFGQDSVTVTFAAPVNAAGVFFNVNLNSGNYDLNTSVGDVSTGSASFDTEPSCSTALHLPLRFPASRSHPTAWTRAPSIFPRSNLWRQPLCLPRSHSSPVASA